VSTDLEGLAREIEARIRGGDGAWDEASFDDLAARAFALQARAIPAYGRLSAKRRVAVASWRDVPAVPTLAFQHLDLFVRPAAEAERVFETSGTTGTRRGRAFFGPAGLALMDAAISVNARRMLFPDGRTTRLLALAPPPAAAPRMIMAYGLARLEAEFALPGGGFFLGPNGLDAPGLEAALARAEADRVPVTLVGASFAFVHFLDRLAAAGRGYRLPAGSRLMDAGGLKGRSRAATPAELRRLAGERLGIPGERCVNLLGMTELASQIYDGTLADPAAPRCKRNPPWTRTRVLDPETLAEVVVGQQGLLCHIDLANLERPLCIQTDDLGVRLAGGFEVLGRACSEGDRGCALGIEELLGRRA
jgi:hypothetical protein